MKRWTSLRWQRRSLRAGRVSPGPETADTFPYRGFDIPVGLARMTGGGPESWGPIAREHMDQYDHIAPIAPTHTVFELGCGIGRDAIELTEVLVPPGRYIGTDIIRPSIDWAKGNIASRYHHFEFHHFDIYSEVHNNVGTAVASDFPLPADDRAVDRIIAQSVFTHIFPVDVAYYLGEFRRILGAGGLATVTFFVLDRQARDLMASQRLGPDCPTLTFETEYSPGIWINDPEHPEGAVAYAASLVQRLIREEGLELVSLHRGYWPEGTPSPLSRSAGRRYGQDIALLRRRH